MVIDSTQASAFQTCPRKWEEQFRNRLAKPAPWLEIGKRLHGMLEAHYIGLSPVGVGYVPKKPEALSSLQEAECQAIFEAYKAAYPIEPFEVLCTECYFELKVPDSLHTYVGKMDAVVRDKATGRLQILEHKTESRGSKRNSPKSWAARTQGSLYCWAASQIYSESCDTVILNVLTKGSDKGNLGPSFRRDSPYRSPENIREALRDLVWIADQIERLPSPAPRFTSNCVSENGWACDYFDLCHTGRSPEQLVTFIETENYLKVF